MNTCSLIWYRASTASMLTFLLRYLYREKLYISHSLDMSHVVVKRKYQLQKYSNKGNTSKVNEKKLTSYTWGCSILSRLGLLSL